MKNQDESLKTPEWMEKFAEQLTKSLKEEKQREIARDAERKKAARLVVNEWRKQGLPYAKEIFDWCKKFKKSVTGKKLLRIGNIYGNCHGVCFFNGWVKGTYHRIIGVSNAGVWFLGSGCGATERIMKTPEKLAADVATETLALACEWIKNEKAWECIKETLLYRYARYSKQIQSQ